MFNTKETIKNLTAQEFRLAHEAFLQLVEKEHKTYLDMEANDEFGSKSYNAISGIDYFKRETMESDELLNIDMDEMIERVNEFQLICKDYENKAGYYTQQIQEVHSDDGWSDIESLYYRLEWRVVIEEVPETFINNAFKYFVRAWLCPEDCDYDREIDCKLLQLFKQGAIDWATLRTLVYTDCEV